MPTKDELIAFASESGVDVSSSATKAEIEAALYDAGYDPMTLEANDVSDETEAADTAGEEWVHNIASKSSDAAHSTYTRVDPDPNEKPTPGHTVEQERGEPPEEA